MRGPFWFVLGIACELMLARRAPIARVLPSPFHWTGAIVAAAGMVITNWAVISGSSASRLTGLALWLGVASPLLVPPVIVAAIHYMFVLPEEAHMERAMGTEYLAYKVRVRRWL